MQHVVSIEVLLLSCNLLNSSHPLVATRPSDQHNKILLCLPVSYYAYFMSETCQKFNFRTFEDKKVNLEIFDRNILWRFFCQLIMENNCSENFTDFEEDEGLIYIVKPKSYLGLY